MKRTGFLIAAVLIPLSTLIWAAEPLPLFEQLERQPLTRLPAPALRAHPVKESDAEAIKTILRQQFELPSALTFAFLNRSEHAGRRFYRFQLYYQSIEILDHDILITVNSQGEIIRGYGRLLNNIATDIPVISDDIPRPATAQLHALLGDSDPAAVLGDLKTQRVIFIDETDKAHDALLVDVNYLRARDQHWVNRQLILDQAGALLQSTPGLHALLDEETVGGAGPSGNPNALREDYEATGLENTPPTTFALTQQNFDGTRLCRFDAGEVMTIDAGHRTDQLPDAPYTFDCTDSTHNSHRPYNHAKSPLNDAHYRAQITTDMFQHYLGHSPFHDEPIRQYVHYGFLVANAFFDRSSESLFYGDGNQHYYPPVELTIVAHEIAHGFTYGVGAGTSKWMARYQAGALNESFSDMAGQAAEYYLYGTNTWQTGQETTVNGRPARYLDRPSLDGVSIEHLDDYTLGVPSHYASGLFNRVFYTLATSNMTEQPTPWNTRYAFELFALANQTCWIESSVFEEAADCVAQMIPMMTARFLNDGRHQPDGNPWTDRLLENQLRKAFAQVGIDNSMPALQIETAFKPTTRLLSVEFENLTRSLGTAVAADDSAWQWHWDFGHDNVTSTEHSPEHTFPSEGDYWVTLTATHPDGQSDDLRMRVSVAADYCAANGLIYSPKDSFTAALALNGQTRMSGADGYRDDSDIPITIRLNTDPAFQLLTGDHPSRKGQTKQVYLWLDQNQNGVFEAPDERLVSEGTEGLLTGKLGFIGEADQNYRLRVITADFYLNGPPCGDFNFAEIEDYTLRWQVDAPEQLTIDAIPLINAVQFVNATNLSQVEAWVWDFGDGSAPSTMASPVHEYTQSGRYTVIARAFDDQGLEIQQWQETIDVDTTTVAYVDLENHGLYVSVDSARSSYPTGTTLHWDFGDGTVTETGDTATHTYTSPGNYTVTLTLMNADNPTGVIGTDTVDLQSPPFTAEVRQRILAMSNQHYQVELNVAGRLPDDRKTRTQEFHWVLGDGTEYTTDSPTFIETYEAGTYDGSVTWRYQQNTGPGPEDWRWRTLQIPFTLLLNSDETLLYCEPALTGDVDYIAGVSFDNTEFDTTDDRGLINPDTPLTLPNGQVKIRIDTGTSEPGFTSAMVRVWLDADEDGVFDTDELLFSQYDATNIGEGQGRVEGWIDLSTLDAVPGHHDSRLRIVQMYSLFGPSDIGACDSVTGEDADFGETEDYRIQWTVLPQFEISTQRLGDQLTVLNETDGKEALNWHWSFGDGQTSEDASPVHRYRANGRYPLTVEVTDKNGTELGQWNEQVVISRETTPSILVRVEDRTLIYDASDSLIPFDSNIEIQFGDGSTSETLEGRHEYRESGRYTVTLTITNDDFPKGRALAKTVTVSSDKGGSLSLATVFSLLCLLLAGRKRTAT